MVEDSGSKVPNTEQPVRNTSIGLAVQGSASKIVSMNWAIAEVN